MTPAASKPAARFVPPWRFALGLGVIVAVIAVALSLSRLDLAAMAQAGWRPKAPDLALVARQSLVLKLHLTAALTALAIGTTIMLLPKGVGLHKTLGWTWVAAMAVTAGSSLFLTGLNGDSLSLIHLLSGWTIIVLPMAVVAIRRRNVAAHRRQMTSLFVGGLVIAGAFTFLPGRLMWRVFFG